MHDRFTLLTRLMRRLDSKSRQLECICSVSSSVYVRLSRSKFDQIMRFVINPALIRSQSSLERRDHEELRILLKSRLIPSRFNQELRYKEEEHCFYRRNLWENYRPLDSMRTDWRPWSRDDRVPQTHNPTIVWSRSRRPILIGKSRCVHVSPPRLPKAWFHLEFPVSLKSRFKHVLKWWSDGPWSIGLTCNRQCDFDPICSMLPCVIYFRN